MAELVCLILICLVFLAVATSAAVKKPVQKKSKNCGPSLKADPDDPSKCIKLSNTDVLRAVNWLAKPAKEQCKKVTTIQGVDVCEDEIQKGNCNIWSTVTSTWCDELGSLEFEKYWSQHCDVTIYQFTVFFKGNTCKFEPGKSIPDYPNINIVRLDMWGARCFNCLYPYIESPLRRAVDVLKLQIRGRSEEDDFDGVQYTILSDLFTYMPEVVDQISQVAMVTSFSPRTMVDSVGREAEHAWNMFASQKYLRRYAAFSTRPEAGAFAEQPRQFTHMMDQAKLPSDITFYHHTFLRVKDSSKLAANDAAFASWKPSPAASIRGDAPSYCKVPSTLEDEYMQKWILEELGVRCHPTRLWVPCDRARGHEAIVPCQKELMDDLAEDYAAAKGWCDFKNSAAAIQPLNKVDQGAYTAFRQPNLERGKDVRLAFLLTVYADAPFVERLVSRLYSTKHYYLLHVDPAGSKPEFERAIRIMCAKQSNMFISKDIPIVYGASTATILLTRTMAWFNKYATGWDYFVPVTGSDYPLVPLPRIEKIFTTKQPPMPFVMAWTPGTSTHLFRLQKTHPIFEEDPLLLGSIDAVTLERGRLLGQVPMEFRSNNFGPPVFCGGQKSFYHLDNRVNKSGSRQDTQWLFPRDKYPNRGRAYADEVPELALMPVDGVFRVWKKSDPATTGAYDAETVDYIVNSEEGRKYWHFFKHMLLGSEEHYYVSLLYNWQRTRQFVQTLSAEIVWNTWELGLWENSGGGFQTHTHFLSIKEWDIIRGFAKRGMIFARKFNTKKNPELLDMIDRYMLLNASTDAGLQWPGYFDVDTTSPGKQWIAMYRQNQTRRRDEERKRRQEQKALIAAGGGSGSSSSGTSGDGVSSSSVDSSSNSGGSNSGLGLGLGRKRKGQRMRRGKGALPLIDAVE